MTYATNKAGIYGAVNAFYALYVGSKNNALIKKLKDCYAVRYFPFGDDKAFCFASHFESRN
ncbi:Uncharacterised protein [Candidatus Bartonella washoeensis]|uniref:Uncharacterized protein n=1 Tax=Candidatus Bartonella washoeensis Sb944nv TaxID=1094563 RepID=J1J0E6_9HYPH|nr:hypothetical protein [Bartonella washoeensis]EJF77025.1 hypothetical protein MCQ_01529 [Bartonella washoeensis Sb944nv]SPU27755.1 Uncharacterised protein [Bartonella washoeensis]